LSSENFEATFPLGTSGSPERALLLYVQSRQQCQPAGFLPGTRVQNLAPLDLNVVPTEAGGGLYQGREGTSEKNISAAFFSLDNS